MIEIRQRATGEVLGVIPADTLAGADLRDMRLDRADVTDADFSGVELASVTMEFANFSRARNAVIPSYKMNLR